MPIQVIPDKSLIRNDPLAEAIISYLVESENELDLGDCSLFYNFPMISGIEGEVLRANLLLASEAKGVILFGTSVARNNDNNTIDADLALTDDVYSNILSKFLKFKELKKNKRTLNFDFETLLFAPNYGRGVSPDTSDTFLATTLHDIGTFLSERSNQVQSDIFSKILSVIDGGVALIRPKPRLNVQQGTRGYLANKVEAEITSFDNKQRYGYMLPLSGVHRIRGLAGSGKTVILAMKAALTHIEHPDATILFTFFTKSLYQLVQKLITRFYRQFSDGTPDFENRLKILHAWGGRAINGVYYQACIDNNVEPMTYGDAKHSPKEPFDFVCSNFLSKVSAPVKRYDYAFIDEGQDFPTSFLKLVVKSTKDSRVVWAYDELQSIFDIDVPLLTEIVSEQEITQDTILYKCYRNPREILVCAHALGFGIYSDRIVQMLESKERWESTGYEIDSGNLIPGSHVKIKRPAENTLSSISESQNIDEIIKAEAFDSVDEEIKFCVECIMNDIQQGLRPDDILVIAIDDRNARSYLSSIAKLLAKNGIMTNNIHADIYHLIDFEQDEKVTLSTLNKAKGNESFSVYVLGIDAVFGISKKTYRNKIFTALTRAKGWVTITGYGDKARGFISELKLAKNHFPYLEFEFPTEPQLAIIKDDMYPDKMIDVVDEREFDALFEKLGAEKFISYLNKKKKGMEKNRKSKTRKKITGE